jgi:hypothetical protein
MVAGGARPGNGAQLKSPGRACASSEGEALKARSSKAQGGGREAAVTLGEIGRKQKPCKGGAAILHRPYRA